MVHPHSLMSRLVADVSACVNLVVNKASFPITPREHVVGRKLLASLLKYSYGTYCIARLRTGTKNDEQARGTFGYVVGRDWYS